MLIMVWVILFQGGYLKEFTDEESNFTAILQRAMDLEGVDRETVYQLVSLLMKVFYMTVTVLTSLFCLVLFCALKLKTCIFFFFSFV